VTSSGQRLHDAKVRDKNSRARKILRCRTGRPVASPPSHFGKHVHATSRGTSGKLFWTLSKAIIRQARSKQDSRTRRQVWSASVAHSESHCRRRSKKNVSCQSQLPGGEKSSREIPRRSRHADRQHGDGTSSCWSWADIERLFTAEWEIGGPATPAHASPAFVVDE
jgi:hypothetical protein